MRWLLVFLIGCAHDVRVTYPGAPAGPTGTLVLQMSQPASGVSVAIDGLLVVDTAHTEHVVIEGVPVGTADVVMAANGTDKDFHVWIGSDHATTVPLGIPDATPGYVASLAGTLLTIVVYTLLHH
jgi:hypothetical protein